jgi:hypothetical protein
MRLTLRTLLAYLDDSLEAADARDIGARVAENVQARDLIARIKTVMRRRRLHAPDTNPDSGEPQAALLAEYLESSLDAARVTELEKQILDDDMLLAELASVHQILSLALSRKPDIPDAIRERIYRLVPGAEAGPKTPPEEEPLAAPAPVDRTYDNLRLPLIPSIAQRPSLPLTAVTVAVLGLMLFVTIRLMISRPNRQRGSVSGMLNQARVEGALREQDRSRKDVPANEVAGLPTDPVRRAVVGKSVAGDDATTEKPAGEEKSATVAKGSEVAAGKSTPASAEAAAETRSGERPLDSVATRPMAKDSAPALATSADPAPGEAPASLEPVAKAAPAPAAKAAMPLAAPGPALPDPIRVLPAKVGASGPVFVVREGKSARMPDRYATRAKDVIVNPPGFRSTFQLDPGGAAMELVGPTRLVVEDGGDDGLILVLEEGRLRLSSGIARRVRFRAGAAIAVVTMEPGSILAVHAEPGAEPSPRAAGGWPISVTLHAIQGPVRLIGASGPVSIDGKAVTVSDAGVSLPRDLSEPAAPAQLGGDPQAAASLVDRFMGDATPQENLRLQINGQRADLRRMAVATLGVLRDERGLADAIHQPDHADVRHEAMVRLRTLVRTDAAFATAFRRVLDETLDPREADAAMKLLIGLTDAELQLAARRREVVEELASDDIGLRELALFNLVGKVSGNHGYAADAPLARRQQSVQQWRKWASEGK